MQLEKKLNEQAFATHHEPRRENCTSPGPSPRSSSLPVQENQPPIRHYRSMLVVDAPTLGPLKPVTYDELYVQDGHYGYGIVRWQALGEAAHLLTFIPTDRDHSLTLLPA